jgi:hypothetical protein
MDAARVRGDGRGMRLRKSLMALPGRRATTRERGGGREMSIFFFESA